MFKPLPQGTIGYVTHAASRIATTLVVDTQLHTMLQGVLSGGHHTYLHIRSAGKVEIVKVVEALNGNAISVKRGQDGSDREAIGESARIFAALNLSALYDQVRGPVTSITLSATGVAQVNPLYVPTVQIKSDSKLEIINQYSLVDGNYDPCFVYQCPGYEVGPFYYTSHIYPIEARDSIIAGGKLTYSQVMGESLQDYAVFGGKLQAAQLQATIVYVTYDNRVDSAVFSGKLQASVLTVIIAYKTYAWPDIASEKEKEAISAWGSLQASALTVVIGYITYNNYPIEGVVASGKLQGATLV